MTDPGTIVPPTMRLPTVAVYVDDQWVADGRDPDGDAPQVLTGLTVRWGRSTVVDQPQPSTCSLTLLDRAGGTRFLDTFRVGGRLDVTADARLTAPPDPDTEQGTPVIVEGFETGIGNAYLDPAGGTATLTSSSAAASAGTKSLSVTSTGATAVTVLIPPGPREPVGGNPAAWDNIPRAIPGDHWTGSVDVLLPPPFAGWSGWAAAVNAVSYDSPWATAVPLLPAFTAAAGTLPSGFVRYTGSFIPPAGLWVGLQVRFWPLGPAWDDADATTTWDALATPGPTWDSLGTTYLDEVKVTAPASGTLRRGMVFSGRITDLEASFDGAEQATLVDVTAADQRAELGNRDVGDQPWPAEPLGTRFGRIVTASGQPIESRVSSTAAAYQVSWRDVDRQPAITLLSELATSADGVLWAATHPVTGPFLLLESLADRQALFVLEQGTDMIVRIVVRPVDDTGALLLDACDVLLEPLRWRQDIEDMATRVQVTWREQTLDEQGNPRPTDRTQTTSNPALEADIGVHRIAIGTQLAVQTDAQSIADAILGRTGGTTWRIGGLAWHADTVDQQDADTLTRLMRLLDGTNRNGLPIVLTGLPEWSPLPGDQLPLYLEGGVYTSVDGAWRLDLVVSAASSTGMSAAWDDMPAAWQWDQMDPAIRWVDMGGVVAP